MAKLKVGDRVEMVERDGCYADFKNPGIVERIDIEGFINASDATGRSFTGAFESRFTAYEPKPPLLKVGQKVRITGGYLHGVGDIGEIVEVDTEDTKMTYKVRVGYLSRWITNSNVEAINDMPAVEKSSKHWVSKHWVIAKLGVTGVPMPAPRPFIHTSESDAVLEAQRLAKACPGVKFVMYAATYEAFVEPPKPVEPDMRLRWL